MTEGPPRRWSAVTQQLPQLPDIQDGQGLLALMGGARGVLDVGLPGLVFAVAYPLTGRQLTPSLLWAVGSAVLLAVIGLAQRRSLQYVLGGLGGVLVMAAVSWFTGDAQDFYLPSLLKNAAYGLAYLVSILVRWPLLGVVLGPLQGEGFAWRKDPPRLRAYQLASWLWVGMFGLRVAVQLPLYLAGAVTALGLLSTVLGLPLFLLTVWGTWAVLRRVPPTRQHGPDPGDPAAPDQSLAEAEPDGSSAGPAGPVRPVRED